MKPIIEVKGLSKKYRLGEFQPYYTLRDSLAGLFRNPLAAVKGGLEKGEFWALKDVNFEVQQGEVVGIIGRNGAGKSTLLKILSQITPPTEGEVILRGRVGSLLEVGTGFSPELTGRENIYLNGAILGMKRSEVRKRFDEIVAFSEVEKFLDTPLKRYSSGMYMRLAFAVAAHLEPEILIVDEVLAVGDAEFQKKCLGKMGEVADEGRTVLFVSHNTDAVSSLCSRAINVDEGKIRLIGTVSEVIDRYLGSIRGSLTKKTHLNPLINGSDFDQFNVYLSNREKIQTSSVPNNEYSYLTMIFRNKTDISELDLTFHLENDTGQTIAVGTTAFSSKHFIQKGINNLCCKIPTDHLQSGFYMVSRLLILRNKGEVIGEYKDILTFEVCETIKKQGWMAENEGVLKPLMEWERDEQ